MSEPLLSARALAKTYTMGKRALEVLRGVNLEVRARRISRVARRVRRRQEHAAASHRRTRYAERG